MDIGMEGLEALDAALPESLPVLPGLSVSGRYVINGRSTVYSGNGLKTVSLPDGRVMLAVVDTLGRGALSTSAAVRVLAVLRGLLESGISAAAAVEGVDRYASRAPLARGASLAVAVISQHDGSVEATLAGHPPPALVRPDGEVVPLGISMSRPLGLGGTPASTQFTMQTGDLLLLHTDGLVTGRDGATWAGIGHLHALLGQLAPRATGPHRSEDISGQLLSGMQEPMGFCDDVALVIAERTPSPSELHVACPATDEGAGEALGLFGSWLSSLGVGMLDEMALNQALDEAVDNVLNHAYPPGTPIPDDGLRVHAGVEDRGVLVVRVADSGHWSQNPNPEGRGLVIAGGLVDRIRLVRGPGGSEVVLEQQLTRPVPLMRADGAPRPTAPPAFRTEQPGRLEVSGAIRGEAEEDFREALHRATAAGTVDSTLDMAGVTEISGTALSMLFGQRERSIDSGAEFNVRAPVGSVAHRVLAQVAFPL